LPPLCGPSAAADADAVSADVPSIAPQREQLPTRA
jgi:hypothetical protein